MTAGQVLHVHSLATGQCISKYGHSALETNVGWEEGASTAPLQVDGSRDGRMVLLAGSDGAIIALDLRYGPLNVAALAAEHTYAKLGFSGIHPRGWDSERLGKENSCDSHARVG